MTNEICLICEGGMTRLNGRWCNILDRLVEYSKTPPCKDLPKVTEIKPIKNE